MSETTYDLIFRGELLPEGDGAVARAELARVLKLDPARLGQLFSGGTVYVRRGADRDTAVRFQSAFRQAGARLRVLPVEAGAAAAVPVPTATPVPAASQAVMAAVSAAASPMVAAEEATPPEPAPPRRMSLAERLAAQQVEAARDDADDEPETVSPIDFVSGGRPLPASGFDVAAASNAAAAVPPSLLDDAPAFTLAPLGADLIDEDERELKAEVMVSVEHIDLAPPGGTIPVLEPRARIRPTVVIPDFEVAEAGALMAELNEFVELPLDLSAYSVAPVGARIGEPQEIPEADVRVDHLTLAPAGADLSASLR